MTRPDEDPAVTHGRREALAALLLFVISLTYTAVYCYQHGFQRPAGEVQLVWGIPHWVFWGVFVPWIGCWAAGCILAWRVMRDDALGEEQDPADREADHA